MGYRGSSRPSLDMRRPSYVANFILALSAINRLSSMTQNNFGEYLFQLRRRKKLLQKQVALSAGFDPSYLAAVENGRRDPPRNQGIEKLLDALMATPIERERIHQLARLTRLTRVMAQDDGAVAGVEIARKFLEVAPRLSAEELAALDTLLAGLSQRPDIRDKEVAM